MALEHTKLDIVNESRNPSKIDDKTLELVFGKQDSPKPNNFEMNDVEKNRGKQNGNTEDTYTSSFPLLESEREKQKPPLAGPEVDDLDGTTPANGGSYPRIGDGLLDAKDDKPHILDVDESDQDDKSDPETRDDAVGTDDDNNNLSPRFGEDVRPMSPVSPYIDVNTYQQKKNLAQGMMDLALLSANANQLRYVLESSTSHPYFYSSLVFITLSIIFQIAVGVGLILNSKYDVNDKEEICKADKINNFTVLGIFLITIVNVFITSFSVATPTVLAATPPILQAGSG